MALDKLIDSAELDAGMTATANAIREKTGSTDPIVWDASNGFKSAVEGIQAGGGDPDELLRKRLSNTLEHLDIDMQGLTMVERAFNSCNKLKTAKLRNFKITEYGSRYMFYECSSLERLELTFSERQNVPSFTTQNSSKLTEVILTGCSSFEGSAFTGTSKLSVLVLKCDFVVGMSNINSLSSTPFASGGTGGTVYCPASLIEQYQQATNWSTLYAAGTCNFVAIEGSEYE